MKMKKLLSILMAWVLILSGLPLTDLHVHAASNVWDGTAATEFAGGTGTKDDPYRIATAEQLAYLANQVNVVGETYEGQYLVLTNDIMLNDTTGWENWNSQAPVNTWSIIGADVTAENGAWAEFCGNFDGAGHKISGIYINDSSLDYAGLFGYVDNTVIKNLNVEKSYICAGDYVGALVGDLYGNGEIVNCSNSGTVKGADCVGGIVGDIYDGSRIINCVNSGMIAGIGNTGGIAGYCSGIEIEKCYNTGRVKGEGASLEYFGGIAGYTYGGRLSNCYNAGEILIYTQEYASEVGGLIGEISGTEMKTSHNVGTVTIILENESADADDIGGAVGYSYGTVKDVYYLENCCAYESSDGTMLSADAMKLEASFTGFDFNDVWGISAEAGYPVFVTHTWENGVCTDCGKTCVHTWNNGGCSACKTVCVHSMKDGSCEICGILCNHTWEEGICTICNMRCDHQWMDGSCEICGKGCENHDWTGGDGVCTNCQYGCPHETFAAGYCEQCGMTREAALIWDGTIAAGFESGSGTKDDPYLITDGAQLAYLAQQVNTGITYEGMYLKLDGDILLNDTTGWESWGTAAPANPWTPIGSSSSKSFRGTFDGNGHAVKGIYLGSTGTYRGLFGYVRSAAIKNLGIEESYISGAGYVGAIVGNAAYGVQICNCYNSAMVYGYSTANTGARFIGGILGNGSGALVVERCYNTGAVTAIAANIVSTNADNYAGYVGGIAGSMGSDPASRMKDCINYGTIYAKSQIYTPQYVGGVVGYGNHAAVKNCINTGNLSFYYPVGSYPKHVGGAAGYQSSSATAENLYHLENCCDYMTNEYSAALTAEQMKTADSFTGFDFTDVWEIKEENGYPSLRKLVLGEDEVICENHSWNAETGICEVCKAECTHSWYENTGSCTNCKMLCTHNWENKDGICLICGSNCEHEFENGMCKTCGKECIHEWNMDTGFCGTCGVECEHQMQDGSCTICQMTCEHAWEAGICTECQIECTHLLQDGVCINCGFAACQEHDWTNLDGICGNCHTWCDHEYVGGKCSICGNECTHRYWNNQCRDCGISCQHDWSGQDGVCAVCSYLCTHEYADDNGCSWCGSDYTVLPKWDGTAAEDFAGGSGTAEDPYQISNGAQLAYFAQFVRTNDPEKSNVFEAHVVLTADIDLGYREFVSIGRKNANGWTQSFAGVFDGRNHKIYGLNNGEAGLFGSVIDAVIKNVHVYGYVNGEYEYTGGIAGYAGRSEFINCSFTGTVASTNASSWVGGIVGSDERENPDSVISIKDCVSNADVTGGWHVGGITGGAEYYSPAIDNCVNNGNVSGYDVIGGIAGHHMGGLNITNCGNNGNLIILAGGNEHASPTAAGISHSGDIYNSYNTGSITSKVPLKSAKISGIGNAAANCYNAGYFDIEIAEGYRLYEDVVIVPIGEGADGKSIYYLNMDYSTAVEWNAGIGGYVPVSGRAETAMTDAQMSSADFINTLDSWVKTAGREYKYWMPGNLYPQIDNRTVMMEIFAKSTDETITSVGEVSMTGTTNLFAKYDQVSVSAVYEGKDHRFIGWYANNDFTKVISNHKKYSFTVDDEVLAKDTYVLTALYEKIEMAPLAIDGGGKAFSIRWKGEESGEESFDGSEVITKEFLPETVVTIKVTDDTDFAYWTSERGKIVSENQEHTFRIVGKTEVHAVYNIKEETKKIIVFESAYQQVMLRTVVTAEELEGLTIPDVPVKTGYKEGIWNMTLDDIKEEFAKEDVEVIIVTPVYPKIEEKATVNVVGGTIKGTNQQTTSEYILNTVVTLVADTAAEGMKFAYWTNESGTVLGYNEAYSFYLEKDITLTAIFVEDEEAVEKIGTAEITSVVKNLSTNKVSVVAMLIVPEGCAIDYAGVVASTNSAHADNLTAANAPIKACKAAVGYTQYRYTWTAGNKAQKTIWARAYLVYTDQSGVSHTIYGDIVEVNYKTK